MRDSIVRGMILVSLLFNCVAPRADEIKDALVALASDPSNSKATFSKLAESENPKILAALGIMFFDGIGVPISHREAMPLLQKAADLNRPEAQYRLGLAYSTWNGSLPQNQNFYDDPPADAALAEQWFHKAANSAQAHLEEDPAAMATLGHLHERGLGGVSKDLTAAKRMFLDAARQGCPDAEVAYATLQQSTVDLRRPLDPEKLQESLGWYGKAAIQGSSEGLEGLGVTYLLLDDRKKALPLLRRAASLGREPASRWLYIHFKEKNGNNIALELDKSFEAKRKIRDMHDLAEKLSDPLVIASAIVAVSALLAVVTYDPNMPESERIELDRRYRETVERGNHMLEEQSRLKMHIDPATGRTWYGFY